MVARNTFDKIPFDKLDVVKLRKVKNVRLGQYGRGNIQPLTNLYQVIVKMRIGQLLGVFIYNLFADLTVRH
jgi:hypothetical protein